MVQVIKEQDEQWNVIIHNQPDCFDFEMIQSDGKRYTIVMDGSEAVLKPIEQSTSSMAKTVQSLHQPQQGKTTPPAPNHHSGSSASSIPPPASHGSTR